MRIATHNLSHRYRARAEHALQPLTHTFEPGTLTAITGPSGSGKSTLLYLLALMLTPSEGVIRWNDDDVHGLTDAARAQLRAAHVGFVFQDAVLDLSRTTLDNVLEASGIAGMTRAEAEPVALALLARFGVAARASHRPGEISGGQAQRIALCRALVSSPSVIFADEPTGNLDRESADVVWDALVSSADGGATVIVATHDTHRAATATQHVRLTE